MLTTAGVIRSSPFSCSFPNVTSNTLAGVKSLPRKTRGAEVALGEGWVVIDEVGLVDKKELEKLKGGIPPDKVKAATIPSPHKNLLFLSISQLRLII
jgi:hypothetical protein